jgi:hypothetical protein
LVIVPDAEYGHFWEKICTNRENIYLIITKKENKRPNGVLLNE